MERILSKTLAFVGVFILILPSFSLASPSVLVKKATLSGDFMPPRHKDAKPQTTFELTVESCKKVSPQEWEVRVEELAERSVAVEFSCSRCVDCLGPVTKQSLTLQTQDIPFHSKIYMKNPLLLDDQTTH